MSITYTQFKDYILKFLWKQNDKDLKDSFDLLVRMADSELNVSLNISDNEKTEDFVSTSSTFLMPAGTKSIRLIMSPLLGELSYLTPSDLRTRRTVASNVTLPYYSLEGTDLLLCFVPSTSAPSLALTVTYNREIPDFAASGASWFADKFLSLYVHAVLVQTAPFLREDERLAVWQSRYNEMLLALKEEDAFARARGVAGRAPAQVRSSV